MAWEARSGLKPQEYVWVETKRYCRNGLGSPFGIETLHVRLERRRQGLALNQIETQYKLTTEEQALLSPGAWHLG